jgi:hypothetical protein
VPLLPTPSLLSTRSPLPLPSTQVTASYTIAIAIARAIGHPAYLQVIIQGTSDGVNWLPYEFPCKPGNVSRRPCTIAPYHYRMDWKMYVCVLFLGTNVRCLLALLFGRVAIA